MPHAEAERARIDPDPILAKAVADYNAANPSQAVELKYEEASPMLVTTSAFLALLPFLLPVLIGVSLYYAMRRRRTS